MISNGFLGIRHGIHRKALHIMRRYDPVNLNEKKKSISFVVSLASVASIDAESFLLQS